MVCRWKARAAPCVSFGRHLAPGQVVKIILIITIVTIVIMIIISIFLFFFKLKQAYQVSPCLSAREVEERVDEIFSQK